jgi:transcriptional regulator with XRE-family HTH domain
VANPLRTSFAELCRDTRTLLDITQGELAEAAGVSRSLIAGIETARVNPTLDIVMRVGDALGLDLQLVGQQPNVIDPRRSSFVHGRCSAYTGRRLGGHGWSIRREVEVIHGRSHGWIDILAFHPGSGTLVIVEIKTRLDDLGTIERQLGWYERAAREVAVRAGWRPVIVVSWLLLLDSEEVEVAIRRERELIRAGFPQRAGQMRAVLDGERPSGSERGLALIDPSSRRAAWLIPTRLDGRRSPAPYRDYADAARRMAI